MADTRIDDLITLNRHDLVKTIIYTKILEKGMFMPTDNDLNVMCLLSYTDDKETVIRDSLDKGYKLSRQSVENALSKMVGRKLVSIPSENKRLINSDLFPNNAGRNLIGTLVVSNIDFSSSGIEFYDVIKKLHATN